MKIIVALLLTSSILYSQIDSVYKFTLPEIKITLPENGKNVTYGFESDKNLFLLSDSNLKAVPDKYKFSVQLSDIKALSFKNGYSTFVGAKYGGFIGAGIGAMFGILNAVVYRPNFTEIALVIPGLTAAGFVAGALIGGFLGSFIPAFDNYDNLPEDLYVRKEMIKRNFNKQKLH